MPTASTNHSRRIPNASSAPPATEEPSIPGIYTMPEWQGLTDQENALQANDKALQEERDRLQAALRTNPRKAIREAAECMLDGRLLAVDSPSRQRLAEVETQLLVIEEARAVLQERRRALQAELSLRIGRSVRPYHQQLARRIALALLELESAVLAEIALRDELERSGYGTAGAQGTIRGLESVMFTRLGQPGFDGSKGLFFVREWFRTVPEAYHGVRQS